MNAISICPAKSFSPAFSRFERQQFADLQLHPGTFE